MQESIRWKGDLWWLSGGRPQTEFVTIRLCYLFVVMYIKISVALLSMEDQRTLGFHQKYLNLCSEDELRFYGFRIFIFG